MPFRGKDEKTAARNLRKDLSQLVEFDRRLQEALPKLEKIIDSAENTDKQMDKDLHEEKRDIDRALKDLKRGELREEDKEMLKEALRDLKEIHQAIQELDQEFETMGKELGKLQKATDNALRIDEDADEDIELILKQELT